MNCFVSDVQQVNLFAQYDASGLYKNQIGAIGAALAHFSVRDEPALITMPTGTGKTAVMVVLSYLMKAKKVLVLTPSQLVRTQIAEQFRNPALLVAKGVLPQNKTDVRVHELTTIIEDQTKWQQIINDHDVIIGIPGTLDQIASSHSLF